jgi:hypothetical protein
VGSSPSCLLTLTNWLKNNRVFTRVKERANAPAKIFRLRGSALLLLLLALKWLLPEVKRESNNPEIEKLAIRIYSVEKLPEKVDFDMKFQTIVPSPNIKIAINPLPQSAFVFVQITPGYLPSFSSLTSIVRKRRLW